MADEIIDIVVKDKVSPAISTKIRQIATDAKAADSAVKNLQAALAGISASSGLQRLQSELAKTTAQQQRLLTEINRMNTASVAAATATQRLSNAQQQGAAATARAAAAATRAQTAAQNLATATARTTLVTNQGATAAQKLATEQQRTAAQTANAAAATDRAALAALRLRQAQDRAAQSSRNAASGIATYVRAAAGILGVAVSANAILATADAYTTLQNKLQNITTSQGQVNRLTNEMFELANRTRSGVEETATAFVRFDRALMNMGKSQDETLRMTETVNKELIVSGATAQEASSALLQLSQGFNAGRLQGDEFRAVSENMPKVLRAVAEALGQPINKVKELSTQGKITSEVLYKAFKLMEKSVDETFAKTLPTIGQSMVVLKNSAMQFFGELNKSTGASALLSKMILGLANNLNTLGVVVSVVGAALLVAVGPSLLAALGTATGAVWTFTAALAANPVGLLVVGITAAVAAIAVFGDEISMTADKSVTLKDTFKAAFSFVTDAAGQSADLVKGAWGAAIDAINELTGGWGEQFRNVGDVIVKTAKSYVNFLIGIWAGAYAIVSTTWNNLPALMKGIFATVVNAGAESVEKLVNFWQIGLRTIANIAQTVAPDTAAALNGALDKVTLKLPRMDTTEGKAAAGDVAKAFSDAFSRDYVGDATNAVLDRAKNISTKRRLAEAQARNAELRGAGASQLGKDDDGAGAKSAERRALALEKVNTQLDNELKRMFQLAPQREAQAKFDQIEESLIQKKIKLTEAEKTSIMGRITAVQAATEVQKQFDAIYQSATGPQREYTATLEAADRLLKQGAISQEQYSSATTKAGEAYKDAQDPMRQHNKDLQQQVELLGMLPKQREIEQQLMQVKNDLLAKGEILSEKELQQLREKLVLVQQLNAQSQAEAALLDDSVGKRDAFITQLGAINKLLSDRSSGFTKDDALLSLNNSEIGKYLDDSQEMVNAQVGQFNKLYDQIEQLRQADLISEKTASAAKVRIQTAQMMASSKIWQGMADSLETAISDALTQGFETGEFSAKSLGDSIVKMFKSYVAKEISSTISKAIMNSISGQSSSGSIFNLGSSGTGTTSGGTNWVDSAKKLWNAWTGSSSGQIAEGTITNGMTQSQMLAAQEAGMSGTTSSVASSVGTAAATNTAANTAGATTGASAAGAVAGYAAWIYAAYQLADSFYERGYNREAVETSKVYNVSGEKGLYQMMKALGMSEKMATIWSGTTRMATLFGRRLKGYGMEGQFKDGEISAQNYQYYKGGVFRSNKTIRSDMSPEQESSFTSELQQLQEGTAAMARVLGYSAEAIQNFTGSVQINVKGLTDSEAAKKMEEEFEKLQIRMMESVPGIDNFAQVLESLNAKIEGAGISVGGMAQVLAQGMIGRMSASQVGEQLSEIVLGGIYNTIVSPFASQIAQAFMTQIIQPMILAVTTGGSVSAAVSQQAMSAVIATANNAMAQLNAILSNPEFQAAMRNIQNTIGNISGIAVRSAPRVKAYGTALTSSAAAAADAARQAAAERARAAQAIKDTWTEITDNLIDEMRRVRAELLGESPQARSLAMAEFTMATAAARAGDQSAAERLPELSRAVTDMAKATSDTLAQQQFTMAFVLNSLSETRSLIGKKFGIALPAFAEGGTHSGGWAMVGERGPELAYMPPSHIYNAPDTDSILGGGEVAVTLKRIADSLDSIEESNRNTAANTATSARTLDDIHSESLFTGG